MVTFRELRTYVLYFVSLAATHYVIQDYKESKDPEIKKQRYYRELKGEGIYRRLNPVYRERILDEEDLEALRKYAP